MGTPLAPRGREAGARPHLIARVQPDLPLDKVFDYLIPDHMAPAVRVGTMVRVPLHGRRVGGWVVGLAAEAATDRPLQPLAKVTGWGPPPELISLARWAAWRWAGRTTQLLGTASPARAVRELPTPAPAPAVVATLAPGVTVERVSPAGDVLPLVLA
ncbi:MAG: hypothetical protein ACR2HM_07575, partial [Acidimicrobiales bacterium]